MFKTKKVFSVAVIAALVIGFTTGPGAEAGGRIPSTVANFGLYLQESFDLNLEPDNFYANPDSGDSNKIIRCDGADDPICTVATSVMVIHNLPVCAIDASFDCIKSVWAVDPTGKKIEGTYLNALPAVSKSDHEAIPSMKLSASRGFGGLWQIPGVINGGGEDKYFVSVRNDSWKFKSSGTLLSTTSLDSGKYLTGIVPVKAVTGNYKPMASRPTWGRLGATEDSGPKYTSDGQRCTVVDTGFCELPQEFPDGYRFGMSVQLTQRTNGWFHGRIALPAISIEPTVNGQLIAIEAEPVKISTLDFTIPTEKVPDSVKKVIFSDVDWGIMGDLKQSVQTMLNGLDNPQTMEIMTAMLPTIGDRATKTTQYWSYRTLTGWNNPEVTKCSNSSAQVGGVVTTNALTYSSGPPTFNKETGALEYKVASPHFESSGKVALGTYDLAVKSDVARCIYGFSSAPISATISIVGESGEQKVATTIVNERNGWLYLSAKGFTFSSPTIKVKLTQDVIAVAAPLTKSSTITCIKGKTTKKVTAVNPKCPSGYKKK
jgi:hypothetical protein